MSLKTNKHNHDHETDDNHLHHHDHAHSKEEILQAKYYEFQLISEQIKQLQQQAQLLEEQTNELNITLQGLTELEGTTQNKEILVPLSPGIFAKAELKDTKNLIINIGSNLMVKKDISKAKEMTQDRIEAVETYKSETNDSLVEMIKNAKLLEKEIQELITEIKG